MDYHCEILSNGVLQGPYRRIVFRAPELAGAAAPGQFVHVRIPACRDRILRRPFSICSADPEAGSLTIVYKIVGEGTGELSRMAPGEFCDVMGPLGHGYTLPGEDTFPILVAGGYGSASTLFLAERSPRKGVLLTGARSADDLILLEEYRKLGAALDQALPECRAELEHYNHLVEKPDSRWFTKLCRFKPRERF